MPRNGSGAYVPITNSWYPPVNGVLASSSDFQDQWQDMASAMTQSVSADGQTTLTGNLPMGGNQLTGLGAPTGNGQALRWQQLTKGSDIASAATLAIPNEGADFDITGTTTITSFSGAYPGRIVYLRFMGALTIQNSASLVLPGGVDIHTNPGDIGSFINTESGIWVCTYWSPYQQSGHGQCRISLVSSTQIRLSPYNGNKLIIDGVPRTIPSGGVTASNSGLAASARYYAYAAMQDGAMVLNFSSTGYTTAPNGVQVKSDDASQTLVGQVGTNASILFTNSSSSRLVLNWFNKQNIVSTSSLSGATFSNGNLVEISTSARHSYLCWANDAVKIDINGTASNSTAVSGATVFMVAVIDGPAAGPTTSAQTPYANTPAGIGVDFPVSLSEAIHFTSVAGGLVSAGASTASVNLSLFTTIQG